MIDYYRPLFGFAALRLLVALGVLIWGGASRSAHAEDRSEIDFLIQAIMVNENPKFFALEGAVFRAFRYIEGEESLMSEIRSKGSFGLNEGVESVFESEVRNVVDGSEEFYIEKRRFWFQEDYFATILDSSGYSDGAPELSKRLEVEIFGSPDEYRMKPTRIELGDGLLLQNAQILGGVPLIELLNGNDDMEYQFEVEEDEEMVMLTFSKDFERGAGLKNVLSLSKDKQFALVEHQVVTPGMEKIYKAREFVNVGGVYIPLHYEGAITVRGEPFRRYEVSIDQVVETDHTAILDEMRELPSGYRVRDWRYGLEYKASDSTPKTIKRINQVIGE